MKGALTVTATSQGFARPYECSNASQPAIMVPCILLIRPFTHALVGVEVQRQLAVVALDNHARAALGGLRANAALQSRNQPMRPKMGVRIPSALKAKVRSL